MSTPWVAEKDGRMIARDTITTGRPLTWDEWVRAAENLEARIKLAKTHGLPKTAQSWRAMIETLQVHG
jgi:hypothetical protein